MKTVGFPISTKENEKRRALLPYHLQAIRNRSRLFFERGYGNVLGHSDDEYEAAGANVVCRDEVIRKDVVCDPKIGDATYLAELTEGQIVFGWVHAVQNRAITDAIIGRKLTAIAWEEMFGDGRHVFWRNNELAGEAAVVHAFTLFGRMPYECKVALIGRGNIARGAFRILRSLGADVMVYDRKTERLLRGEIGEYDVVINGVLWDIFRKDHIICAEDLSRMKRPSMIIDISCDRAGGVETSIPTTIEKPTYLVDGVLHYVVDHTPALFSYSATQAVGDALTVYLDDVVEGNIRNNAVLMDALIIQGDRIIDGKIIEFQGRVRI